MTRGLTKAAIVAAALGALDETGLDGLTVRVVATRLGVQPPALYWHFSAKQDLLDEMATQIWREITDELRALPADIRWDEAMAAFARITRQALLSRRDGAKMVSGTYLTDTSLLREQEAGLASMLAQGFTVATATEAYQLLYSFIIGFCIEEQAVSQAAAAGDSRYSLANRAERVGAAAHPLVAEAGPEIFSDRDRRYTRLVGAIVGAAGRMRDPAAAGEISSGRERP
ncbi:MAG TPA: TetR/AcrR family transcriptional regulator C-terminal domain-containing protein [Streptosporangiaceae bacterium]|nr:TetR/AcrR family transcriptional regulator C-terminal domain-containing protein [Streptosporangiaceae bacterium]